MDREVGYKGRNEEIFSPFPHSLSISSPFPLHFLILSSFPRSPAARLQRFVHSYISMLRAHHVLSKGVFPEKASRIFVSLCSPWTPKYSISNLDCSILIQNIWNNLEIRTHTYSKLWFIVRKLKILIKRELPVLCHQNDVNDMFLPPPTLCGWEEEEALMLPDICFTQTFISGFMKPITRY